MYCQMPCWTCILYFRNCWCISISKLKSWFGYLHKSRALESWKANLWFVFWTTEHFLCLKMYPIDRMTNVKHLWVKFDSSKVPARSFTWADTLRTPVLMRVDDSFVTSYHLTAHQRELRIALYCDSCTVCYREGGVAWQVVLSHHPSTLGYKNYSYRVIVLIV